MSSSPLILPMDRFHMEKFCSYNISVHASRYNKRLQALNRELSRWVRCSIADMLKYKIKCAQINIEFAEKNPYRTSKLCHICKKLCKRSKVC
ncbi:MAG: hypothetical protein ACTSQP_18075 [Promethearchaeota archaeon]